MSCRQQEVTQKMGERFREKVEEFKETARDAVVKTGRQWEAESKEIGQGAKNLLKTKTTPDAEKYGAGSDTPALQVRQQHCYFVLTDFNFCLSCPGYFVAKSWTTWHEFSTQS